MKGKVSWNRGRTLPECVREKIRLKAKDNPNYRGVASTAEKETLRRLRISETAKRNGKMGGYRERSGWTQWFKHNSPYAGEVFLNGTWELAFARYLDANAIPWVRNKQSFDYEWEGKNHKYFPDFYLNQTDEFVEIKGYVVPKDAAKWEAVRKSHTLIVYRLDDLVALGVLNAPQNSVQVAPHE